VEIINSRHSLNQGNKNEQKWSRNEESAQEREGEEEEREEHIKNTRIDSNSEHRRTQGGYSHYSLKGS
jgi:hypothetical protein